MLPLRETKCCRISDVRIAEFACMLMISFLLFAGDLCAQTTLIGTKDFPVLKVSGFAQYYKGDRCGSTGCIEVDGDKTGYQFGAAQTTFKGASGIYSVTLSTCGDANGLCKYFMKVGGKSVTDTFTQSQYKDGLIMPVTWKNIQIKTNDIMQLMSNGSDSHHDAGGMGPNGFHMAHGRWTKVVFTLTSATGTYPSVARQSGNAMKAAASTARTISDCLGRQIRNNRLRGSGALQGAARPGVYIETDSRFGQVIRALPVID